jgi:hypothetical protein
MYETLSSNSLYPTPTRCFKPHAADACPLPRLCRLPFLNPKHETFHPQTLRRVKPYAADACPLPRLCRLLPCVAGLHKPPRLPASDSLLPRGGGQATNHSRGGPGRPSIKPAHATRGVPRVPRISRQFPTRARRVWSRALLLLPQGQYDGATGGVPMQGLRCTGITVCSSNRCTGEGRG